MELTRRQFCVSTLIGLITTPFLGNLDTDTPDSQYVINVDFGYSHDDYGVLISKIHKETGTLTPIRSYKGNSPTSIQDNVQVIRDLSSKVDIKLVTSGHINSSDFLQSLRRNGFNVAIQG